MQIQPRKPITITKHAQQRLIERVKTHDGYRSWENLVQTARYSGVCESGMSSDEICYVYRHFDHSKFNNSKSIRLFKGFFYVFCGNKGKARTLVTVIKYENDK